MTKADSLRLRDVRDAYRLIGACRDVGNEPALWQRTMLDGLMRLFGVTQATGGEGWWNRPGGIRPISSYDVSVDPAVRDAFLAYVRENGVSADPIFHAIRARPKRLVTNTRRELVSDAEWYRSIAFNEFRRRSGVDHQLTSICRFSEQGAISCIALLRSAGDRDFSPREGRLLAFFHAELGRLIGSALVSETEPGLHPLSPRLRQTLACLLEGDSEMQVASRLGLSRATVHQYVTSLYRYFEVHSRSQLMARAMARLPRQPSCRPGSVAT